MASRLKRSRSPQRVSLVINSFCSFVPCFTLAPFLTLSGDIVCGGAPNLQGTSVSGVYTKKTCLQLYSYFTAGGHGVRFQTVPSKAMESGGIHGLIILRTCMYIFATPRPPPMDPPIWVRFKKQMTEAGGHLKCRTAFCPLLCALVMGAQA